MLMFKKKKKKKKIAIHVLLFVIINFLISKIDRTCFSNVIPGTTFFNA